MKKLFQESSDPNATGASLLGSNARKNLKDFLSFFRKDYVSKIDWNKGYEILDSELGKYVSQQEMKQKDHFYILVKAFNPQGTPFRFIINTIVELNKGQLKVGIAEIPDEIEPMDEEEDDDEMDGVEMMDSFAKNFLEGLQSGAIKPLDNTPNCSRCGRSDLPLTISIDAVNLKVEKVCPVCMKAGRTESKPPKAKTVAELDKEIAEYEGLAKKYEALIKEQPKQDNLPDNLARYAVTPMSSYRSVQAVLADLKAQRMQAMTTLESETRLEYELKKALEVEDYKRSAELRDQLNKLRGKV